MKSLFVGLVAALVAVTVAGRGDITLVSGGVTASVGSRNAVHHIFIDPSDNLYRVETRFNATGRESIVVRRMNPAGTTVVWTYASSDTGIAQATGVKVFADANRVYVIGNDQLTGGTRRGFAAILSATNGAELFKRTLTDAEYLDVLVENNTMHILGSATISGARKLVVNRINVTTGVSSVFADPEVDSRPVGFLPSTTGFKVAAVRQNNGNPILSLLDPGNNFNVIRNETTIDGNIDRRLVTGTEERAIYGGSGPTGHTFAFLGLGSTSISQSFSGQKAAAAFLGTSFLNANGTTQLPDMDAYFTTVPPTQLRKTFFRTTSAGSVFATTDTVSSFFPELQIDSFAQGPFGNELLAGNALLPSSTTGKDIIVFSPRTNRFFAFDGGSGREDRLLAIAVNSLGDIFVGGFATNAAFQRATFFAKLKQEPLTNSDVVTVFRNRAHAFPVALNDVGLIPGTTFAVETAPTNGSVSLDPTSGVVTYTANLNFVGRDSFQYRATNANGTDVATASVVIQPTIVNLAVPASVNSGERFNTTMVLSDPVPEAIQGGITGNQNTTLFGTYNFARNERIKTATIDAPVVIEDTLFPVQGSFDQFGPFKANRAVLVRAVPLTLAANDSQPIGGDVVVMTLSTALPVERFTPFTIGYDPQLSGPSELAIQPGTSSTSFQVNTSLVFSAGNRTVSATVGSRTVAATLTLQPGGLRFFTLRNNRIVGGQAARGQITLTGPLPRAATYNVTYGAGLSGASSITVAQGQAAAEFAIGSVSVVSATNTVVTVSRGQVSLSQTVTILPAIDLESLSLSASSVRGGGRATATLRLNAEAFGNGQAVTLASSNNAAASFGRASITIPAGSLQTTLLVLTNSVTSNTPVTLFATVGATTRTATLTVTP